MYNPESRGEKTDFYVIGLLPSDLEGNICHQIATYHEIGHALIADKQHDVSLYAAALRGQMNLLPPVLMASRYAQSLRTAIPQNWKDQIKDGDVVDVQTLFEGVDEDPQVEIETTLFHERLAWAAGIRLQRERGLPIGFKEKKSLIKYARFWLETYAYAYDDRRFTEGLRSH